MDPLLFTLFINDVSGDLKYATILIFFDDIKFFSKINTFHTQEDLKQISTWADLNLLKLNCSKCKSLTIFRWHKNLDFAHSISGELLESVL